MEKKLPLPEFKNEMKQAFSIRSLVVLLTVLCSNAFAQVELVKDINTHFDPSSRVFTGLTDVNGTLFLRSQYKNLWKTDGTEAGTVPIKNFKSIVLMTKIGGALFFSAADETNGEELWKSDGTVAGTVLVKDIRPGTNGSGISNFVDVNGIAYFVADDGTSGREIWKSDGTAAGTVRVKDIINGGASGNPTNLVSFNNKLFFVSNGPGGYELWSSDGTSAGTTVLKDIVPGQSSSAPNFLTKSGSYLYFAARDASNGQELWRTDGTTAGTVLVKDVRPGTASSFPRDLFDVDGTLFFIANDGVHAFELWKSDGTAAGTVPVVPGGTDIDYNWLYSQVSLGGAIYFQVGDDIYRSDGTAAGTQIVGNTGYFYTPVDFRVLNNAIYYIHYDGDLMKIQGVTESLVKDLNEGSELELGYGGYDLAVSNNTLFFVANNPAGITSLWKSDGTTAGTVVLQEGPATTLSGDPTFLTDVNGTLYFRASDELFAYGLWKSDGTAAGTQKVFDMYFSYMVNVNGTLYLANNYLYKSDGTSAGTVLVSTAPNYPYNLTNVNGMLYFVTSEAYGSLLWKSDGTAAGTTIVENFGNAGDIRNLTNVNGMLYFTANDGVHGEELWAIKDGHAVMMRDIYPGSSSSRPMSLIANGNYLFFVANNGTHGYELWRSIGTTPGTVMIEDINTGDADLVDVQNLIVVNDRLYFKALDASGWALWRSNTTLVGTFKVKDFYPGNDEITLVEGLSSQLYVLAVNENQTLHELWKSNGTEASTVKVKTLPHFGPYGVATGLQGSAGTYLNIQVLPFNDREIWRTDGTECGTFKIDYDDDPLELTLSGSNILFSGDYNLVGRELLKLNESEIIAPPCMMLVNAKEADPLNDQGADDSEYTSADVVSGYPNPYQNNFTLRVNGDQNEVYDVQIINMSGEQTDHYRNLNCNVDYNMGSTWKNGIYLLKIHTSKGALTKKMMRID